MLKDSSRGGLSLIEILVVIAICATVLALLIPAVQMVRDMALRVQSQNNMRQLTLAIHTFADAQSGNLPTIDGAPKSRNPNVSLLVALLPYIEQDTRAAVTSTRPYPLIVKTYISPADPSLTGSDVAPASYAANAQVFQGTPGLPWTLADGTSHTIMFAEHYAHAANSVHFFFDFCLADAHGHRATFADGGPNVCHGCNCGDDFPLTAGQPPVSHGAWHGTFQIAPRLNQCNGEEANTPHRGGMLVSMGDGSSRIISSDVSPDIYWGMVTPRGGEFIGDN